MTTVLRATFDGKVLIPAGPVDLPAGQEVELRVTAVAEERLGSPALLLRVMREGPHLTPADINALEDAIEAGHSAPAPGGAFDHLDQDSAAADNGDAAQPRAPRE